MGEGVPQHVLDLLAGIDFDRFTVDVVCPTASSLWAGLEGRNEIRRHKMPAARRPSPADVYTLIRLWPLVRRADVIHAHSAKAGFLARLAAALQARSGRCVFTPHAWSFWAASGQGGTLYTRLERLAARWCRTILVVSRYEREAGLAAGIGDPDKYRVVLNGVDVDRFSAAPHPQPGKILMLGRLSPQKRPDLAIEALRIVRREFPDATLDLVGKGPWKSQVEQQAVDAGLAGSVDFLGDRNDVPELLAQAACLVLPSDYEGCPLTVIEAMAAGVPVVATRVGGVPELVEHDRTGLLVEPGDAHALASSLCELLRDPRRARALGDAGRERARRHFFRARMAEAIVSVYDDIASKGDTRARGG